MLFFLLGILVGVIFTGFIGVISVIVALRLQEPIKEINELFNTSVEKITLEDVVILESPPSDIEAIEKIIEENDAKGLDTKLSEINAENL